MTNVTYKELITWLWKNCTTESSDHNNYKVRWNFVNVPIPGKYWKAIEKKIDTTKYWTVKLNNSTFSFSYETLKEEILFTGTIFYNPDKLYFYKVVLELKPKPLDPREHPYGVGIYHEFIKPTQEKTMPVVDEMLDTNFVVSDVLHIVIGDYEYNIDVENPNSYDVKQVFKEVYKLSKKHKKEAKQMKKLAKGKLPKVVRKEIKERGKQIEYLIKRLHAL